jgi:hypothetical protein
MLEVLPRSPKRPGFQSFAGIILSGERSRKGVDELDHSRIEREGVALFGCGVAARLHLSRPFALNGTFAANNVP